MTLKPPIEAYTIAVDKIENMLNEIHQLKIDGITTHSNFKKVFEVWTKLRKFCYNPNTGYMPFDTYIKDSMSTYEPYEAYQGGLGFIKWCRFVMMPDTARSNYQKMRFVHKLRYVLDPAKYKLVNIIGEPLPNSKQPPPLSFDMLITIQMYNLAKTICKESKFLEDRIESLSNENKQLQNQIGDLNTKFVPELIEYDYDEIKSRISPIRAELKMAQRIFGKAIRLRYMAPVAIAVSLK